jgi:hypothetical protein
MNHGFHLFILAINSVIVTIINVWFNVEFVLIILLKYPLPVNIVLKIYNEFDVRSFSFIFVGAMEIYVFIQISIPAIDELSYMKIDF